MLVWPHAWEALTLFCVVMMERFHTRFDLMKICLSLNTVRYLKENRALSSYQWKVGFYFSEQTTVVVAKMFIYQIIHNVPKTSSSMCSNKRGIYRLQMVVVARWFSYKCILLVSNHLIIFLSKKNFSVLEAMIAMRTKKIIKPLFAI